MSSKFYSKRNLEFLLYEVLDVADLSQYSYYHDYNKESCEMVLEAAEQIATRHLLPYMVEMDQKKPQLIDGSVIVHPQIRNVMKLFGDGGWISATFPYESGGQQMPLALSSAATFIFSAANYSASAFPYLTMGAANLIRCFGSLELKKTYVEKMCSGKWQGTMALTEPDAGSSLADITTMATSTDSDHYKIKGQKIFISAGDHNGTDNIVHLLLAKIPGAPAGIKGISLFVVPKKRLDTKQNLIDNDVVSAGIFHKMGYCGTPAVHLKFGENDNCHGYLVGKAHHGLVYMFQMMNEARVLVGLGAAATATAAYYTSLEYAQQRPQGRSLLNKDPSKPQIAIIKHADIKRMLLFQKAIIEGSLALSLECCKYMDLIKIVSDEKKEHYQLLLELLTPVAKSYAAEMCNITISAAMQILGGAGYCCEFPIEQFYRDARIHPIHEGTTGIQGLDLLSRKISMHNGKALTLYFQEIAQEIEQAKKYKRLYDHALQLEVSINKLKETTQILLSFAQQKKVEIFLADSTLYLELFGTITIAWQWLKQGVIASKALEKCSSTEHCFYQGKLYALSYFYGYELPKISSLCQCLQNDKKITLEIKETYF